MTVQIAFQAPGDADRIRPDRNRPKCPRCGSIALVAARSAFNPNGRIRHTWSCDDCGNEFVTSIRVFPPQA
jgi:hypothetical protein